MSSCKADDAPSERIELVQQFGPPPLVDGEDEALYHQFHASTAAAVKPKDFLEEIFVRDIVDLSWEALRLRRLKASLFASQAYRGVREVLRSLMPQIEADALAKRWAAGERQAVKKVDQRLAAANLIMSIEAVTAKTLWLDIDSFERLERMTMAAEARRNSALRELDRHRSALADALRRATDDVVDADFEDVKAVQPAHKELFDGKRAPNSR
jgi:hypothetical protein